MATLTSDTVENILEIISDLRSEASTNTNASRIRAVSRAERDYARRKDWLVHLRRNVEITASGNSDETIGSSTYPMKEHGLTEVFIGGLTEDKRVTVVNFHKYQNIVNADNGARAAYEWYDQANDAWKVHINPAPDAGVTIYYSYYYQPPKRTARTDMVVTTNPMIIARLALADIYDAEEEQQMAALQRQIAEQLMVEAIGRDNSPAIGQIYQMGAIENAIKSHGYGSY